MQIVCAEYGVPAYELKPATESSADEDVAGGAFMPWL
jgi:hypothetical protein